MLGGGEVMKSPQREVCSRSEATNGRCPIDAHCHSQLSEPPSSSNCTALTYSLLLLAYLTVKMPSTIYIPLHPERYRYNG